MATKLSALLGIQKTVKENTQRTIDTVYKEIQKRVLFDGLTRTYRPRDEENGEQLPAEGTLVQNRTETMLTDLTKMWARMLNVTATVDVTNTHAAAPIVVGDRTISEPLPATHLVYLEKQLVNLHTLVKAAPVLDPAKPWAWDNELELWTSGPTESVRSKKVPRNHVRFEGNDKHAPQVDVYNEDVTVGTWSKTDLSGAISPRRKRELLDRIQELLAAVRVAREEANATEVTDVDYGSELFSYILGV